MKLLFHLIVFFECQFFNFFYWNLNHEIYVSSVFCSWKQRNVPLKMQIMIEISLELLMHSIFFFSSLMGGRKNLQFGHIDSEKKPSQVKILRTLFGQNKGKNPCKKRKITEKGTVRNDLWQVSWWEYLQTFFYNNFPCHPPAGRKSDRQLQLSMQ